jgi:hypothetical protein
MNVKIKKNKDLGVYMVGKYKIGDVVEFVYGEEDIEKYNESLKISGFSDDGKEVHGWFDSDDCGGSIKFEWIKGLKVYN